MNNLRSVFQALFIAIILTGCNNKETTIFEVTYDSTLGLNGYDGRLLLMITKDSLKEPRFNINDSNETGIIIGKNVQQWNPGQKELFNSSKNLKYFFALLSLGGININPTIFNFISLMQ